MDGEPDVVVVFPVSPFLSIHWQRNRAKQLLELATKTSYIGRSLERFSTLFIRCKIVNVLIFCATC